MQLELYIIIICYLSDCFQWQYRPLQLLELCLKAVLGTVGCVSGCLRPCVATVLTALLAVLQLCKVCLFVCLTGRYVLRS